MLKEWSSSQRTLVLGLGNPLSGDDRFGALVLELLHRNEMDLLPGVSLVNAGTDLLNRIENFPEYDQVVLIDAVLDPEGKMGQPGQILVLDETALQSLPDASQSVHQVTPLLGIKLFRTLHPAVRTRITLVGLLVDRITHAPYYATGERIHEAADAIKAVLLLK
jgi:hydrogenase maturation protease